MSNDITKLIDNLSKDDVKSIVEKIIQENGNLREEVGRLKALLEVSNHQKRIIPTDEL